MFCVVAEEVSTLFRGTSLTTTLMDQYMKMVAIPYVQQTIGDVVVKILDCKQSCEVDCNVDFAGKSKRKRQIWLAK